MTPELERALIHHRNGRLDEAARCYQEILSESPRDFDPLFYLAQVRAAQDRLDESFKLMRAAAEQRPDSAEAQFHLGTLLVSLRRPNQAIAHLEKALALNPGHARALNVMATALRAVDRLDDAVAYARMAVEADPDFAEAHRGLGRLLTLLELPGEALPVLERARELDPNHPLVRTSLAGVYRILGRWDEAIAQCEAALELDPQFSEAHAVLGDVAMELGKLDDAKRSFERAIALAPEDASYYCRLVSLERTQPGSPNVAKLEAFAQDPALYKEERIRLAFALGKAYADLGEHERSWGSYQRGNALHRELVDYAESETLSSLALTAQVFTRDFVERRSGWGFPSEVPIFIVGMPRSGTTLIEQILASHPNVFAGGELPDFQRYAKSVLATPGTDAIEIGPMQNAGPKEILAIGERYVEAISSLAPDARRITDKMPANANFLGLIHLALPNAHVIHARRDPLDTCLSCFSLLFAEGQAFTYDLGELGRYYRAYEKLMDHWHDVLPHGAILDVQYEDVVDDLETQARRIVAFCGLPWDEACLRFYETQRPVQTASVLQVRRPIYRTSVRRWRPDRATLAPLYAGLEIEPPS